MTQPIDTEAGDERSLGKFCGYCGFEIAEQHWYKREMCFCSAECRRLGTPTRRPPGGFAPIQSEPERIYWKELLPEWIESKNSEPVSPTKEEKDEMLARATVLAKQRKSDRRAQLKGGAK